MNESQDHIDGTLGVLENGNYIVDMALENQTIELEIEMIDDASFFVSIYRHNDTKAKVYDLISAKVEVPAMVQEHHNINDSSCNLLKEFIEYTWKHFTGGDPNPDGTLEIREY